MKIFKEQPVPPNIGNSSPLPKPVSTTGLGQAPIGQPTKQKTLQEATHVEN